MKFGMCLPYMEPDFDRKAMMEWFRKIDEGPYYSLSCGERITGPTLEMRVMLAAAAAVTERVRINPSLYVLPMHSAVWAAKEIATLDVLSEGRVTATVGVGGREKDYQAVGASFTKRHQRMDEQIAEMKNIWAGNPPFDGADPVGPVPVQAGGPPILIGAMGPKSTRRGAEWADGVYSFSMTGSGEEISNMFSMADEAWQDAGRDSKPYRMGGFWYTLVDNGEQKLKQYVFEYLKIVGDEIAQMVAETMVRFDEGAIREAIDAYEDAGCDELMLSPVTIDIVEIDRLSEIIASR
jgi:alkanesulfonate monooxygenase SsuD/methylene tetrahydromethanopterin reductase-like flavin-dependent oxidoreductase (luciferase family)